MAIQEVPNVDYKILQRQHMKFKRKMEGKTGQKLNKWGYDAFVYFIILIYYIIYKHEY